MKISIITATWNSESSILDTLNSIAEQNYPRDQLEWIVVDGASTDRTLELIKQADFQPDRILSEPDNGIYDALNKGIRMSTGEVVGLLHADDFFAFPEALSSIVGIVHNSGAKAVYGDLQYVRPLIPDGFSVVRYWKSGVYSQRKVHWGWMPPHPALYLKKEIYDKAKLDNGDYFDTSFNCAADYDFMLRIFTKYEVIPVYLDKVLVKMRIGGVSNRSLKHVAEKSREDWHAIRNNGVGHVHTLIWKNLSKLGQFFSRD